MADKRTMRPRRIVGAVLAVIVASVGAVVGLSHPAGAAGSKTYTIETPFVPGDWDTSLAMPRFDPSWGALTGVHLRLSATMRASAQVENLGAAPATVPVSLGARAAIDVPFELMLLGVNGLLEPASEQSLPLGAFDGQTDYDGPSGVKVSDIEVAADYTGDFEPGAFLIGFLGEGDLEIPATVTARSTVGGADDGGLSTATETSVSLRLVVTYDFARAGVAVRVDPANQTVANGDDAVFSVVITNLGEIALRGIFVGSDTVEGCNQVIDEIEAGGEATIVCHAEHITAPVTNHIVVGGQAGGTFLTGEASGAVAVGSPAVGLEVSPARQTVHVGDTVTIAITVTNRGDLEVRDVVVDTPASPACLHTIGVLAPGAQQTRTCTTTALMSSTQRVRLRAVAGIAAPQELTVEATSELIVEEERPELSVAATVNGASAPTSPGKGVEVGAPLEFAYVVTNTGAATLVSVSVSDPAAGPVSCPPDMLAPGASMTCHASGTQTAIAPVVHTVEATGSTLRLARASARTLLYHFGRRVASCPADGLLNDVGFSVNGGPAVGDLRLTSLRPGDTVNMQWASTGPDAAGCTVAFALYRAESAAFEVEVDQTLIGSAVCTIQASDPSEACAGATTPGGSDAAPAFLSAAAGGPGVLTFQIPPDLAGPFQLDAVTGTPLAVVGPGGGYYSGVLSGDVNRLISARNAHGS